MTATTRSPAPGDPDHERHRVGDIDLDRLSPARVRRRHATRRVIDVAVAGPALVLSAPVGALVALAVALVDPGPVLYRQTREGLDGRPFELVKFRSMYRDADVRLEEYLITHPDRRLEWKRLFKLDPDPRILPRVGNFLRRSSLDELPNLLNVLRGEMTLVGPRPFPAYHLDSYPPALRALRARVKPGLTGLWQVVRGGLDTQTECDTVYLQRTSAWFDAGLVLRTIPLLWRGKSHY